MGVSFLRSLLPEERPMQNGAVSYGRDIYESLAEYITDERYHQAVLLNGSWRSGKTWFIKEEFIPAFE